MNTGTASNVVTDLANIAAVNANPLDYDEFTTMYPPSGYSWLGVNDSLNAVQQINTYVRNHGQATLNGQAGVTVSTPAVTNTTSRIFLQRSGGNGTINQANVGELSVGSIVNNTSFTIYSSNTNDTYTVNWVLFNV